MNAPLLSHVHDYCAHKTGFLCQKPDTSEGPGGWSWHRTLMGALAQRECQGRGKIYRIISDDQNELVGLTR